MHKFSVPLEDIQIFQISKLSSISILIMTLMAFFSYGYVHSTVLIADNLVQTQKNLAQMQPLFTLGIIGWCVIIITDFIVSYGFFRISQLISPSGAVVVGLTRLVYSIILTGAVSQLVILNLYHESLCTTCISTLLHRFEFIWSSGLIIFGIHLLGLGYLSLKRDIPKFISYCLVVGGISYTLIHFIQVFLPSLSDVAGTLEMILMLPMVAGELGFAVWIFVNSKTLRQRLYSPTI